MLLCVFVALTSIGSDYQGFRSLSDKSFSTSGGGEAFFVPLFAVQRDPSLRTV